MPTLDEAKNAGNQLVALAKNYAQAIVEYTKGLDDPANDKNDPVRHLLFGNRALCHLELKNFEAALADALASVSINDRFVKGWYRAGLASRALSQDPEKVASFFNFAFQLDSTLADAAMQRDELLSLNSKRNYTEMVALSTTFSLLRQLWYDCHLGDKVTELTEKQGSPQDVTTLLKTVLEKACGSNILASADDDDNNENAPVIESVDGTDAIHVASLLPEWNITSMSSSTKNKSKLLPLLSFIHQHLGEFDTGFDLMQYYMLQVQDKAEELATSGAVASFASRTDEANNADPGFWFVQNAILPSETEAATKAKTHMAAEGYVYAMSGKPLQNVPGETLTEVVARVRNLKSEHGIVPHKNRRLAVRTAHLIVFEILVPLLCEWCFEQNLVAPDSLPRNVATYFSPSSRKSIQSGACAACLKKFILDEDTGDHIKIVQCDGCAACFYCSKKCRDAAATAELGHNTISMMDDQGRTKTISAAERKQLDLYGTKMSKYACPGLMCGLARKFREEGNLLLSRFNRDFFNIPESEIPAEAFASDGLTMIPQPDICSPQTSALVFAIPTVRNQLKEHFLPIIKRSTNWTLCERDIYGDGDQSEINGQMPNQPGGALQHAWGEGADFNPTFLSQFMTWCMEGQAKKVSAALAALPDDEERKKAANRRESLLRLSPLHGCIGGARMHTGPVTSAIDHFTTAKILIRAGSSITAKDILGTSVAAHCATSYASDLSLRILIYIADTFPDEGDFTVKVANRLGSWVYQESVMARRTDVLRTLIMLGANPYKPDRMGTMMLIGPAAMVVADMADAARKCLPNSGIKRGDIVGLHSLRQNAFNGLIGKVTERLPGGKYHVEIPDVDKMQKSGSSFTKVIAVPMENTTPANACPNCDDLSLCSSLCTKCRTSFCGEICLTSHSCAASDTGATIPSSSAIELSTTDKSMSDRFGKGANVQLMGAKAVTTAAPPKLGEFFIVKVSLALPPGPSNPMEAMMRGGRAMDMNPKMIMIYDATQSVQHQILRDNKNGAQFDRVVRAVQATREYGGVKAFMWAVLDTKNKLMIDESLLPPPQTW